MCQGDLSVRVFANSEFICFLFNSLANQRSFRESWRIRRLFPGRCAKPGAVAVSDPARKYSGYDVEVPMIQLLRSVLAIVLLALLNDCKTQQVVDTSRQYQENAGKFVQTPAASSVFPTDGVKWYPLEIGNGSAVAPGGKRTWLVELRGWISQKDTNCNPYDPDWHWNLEVDPDWADSAGMPLTQLLRPGNMISHVSEEQTGDARVRTVVGIPNLHVELNGYVPSQHGGAAAPGSWSSYGVDCTVVWVHGGKTAHSPPVREVQTVAWPFDPERPLSWQDKISEGAYVRMYGALTTDAPHTSEGTPAQFFCRQFNLGPACNTDGLKTQQRLALVRWAGNRAEEDPTNQARWTELHPPDMIAILSPKAHTTNLRSVAVSAENCLVGPCETTSLDVDLPAPSPKPQVTSGVAFREEVIPATNFHTIRQGHRNAAGDIDGATVTVTAAGIHVHVAVQGDTGYGAHGRFGALYRVSWAP